MPPQDKALQFSFKHFQPDHPRFPIENCSRESFCALFERLRSNSLGSIDDFLDQNNKEHRHMIDFEATAEKDGFIAAPGVDSDQINYLQAWQFGVSPHTDWRAHGSMSDGVFYVIWFDPLHRLSPR